MTSSDGFTPAAGMIVTAWIDGASYGHATLVQLTGGLADIMQVSAENVTGPSNGCSAEGKQVTFTVDGQAVHGDSSWNNSQAWFLSLTGRSGHEIYQPLAVKPAGP